MRHFKSIGPYLGVGLLGFLAYFHIRHFSYTYLDDASLIIDTSRAFSADPFSVFRVFLHNLFSDLLPQFYYRPVFAASFMLNRLWSGDSLYGYYLTNIVLHVLAACLFFNLLIKLRYGRSTAFLLAAFYVVHPTLVQAVAWLPGRSDTLLAIFSMLSFRALMDFIDSRRPSSYFFHLLFFLLALFSKESAFCLIAVFFFYIRLVLAKKFFHAENRFLITGWLLTLALWLLLRHVALVNPPPVTAASLFFLFRSGVVNAVAILQYMGRTLFPFRLSVWPTLQDSAWIPGLLTILLLILGLRSSKTVRWNFVLFGALWFILFLIPTLIRPSEGPAAQFFNHRVYLSMVGFMIVLAETDMIKSFDVKKRIPLSLFLGAFIFYFLITLEHSYDFRDSTAFWANARRTSPHFWVEPLSR